MGSVTACGFRPAKLVERRSVGGGLSVLTVELAAAGTHRVPGQYAEVRADGATGFFVVASVVGAPVWEFVLRGGGGAADALLSLPLGASFESTEALGDGFPCGPAKGRRLLMCVNGTGIAAARPVTRRRIADGDAERTCLVVGVRSRQEEPLADELTAFAAAGVAVTVCLSQGGPPSAGEPRGGGGRYAPGYVQDRVDEWARAGDFPWLGGALGPPEVVFAVGATSLVEVLRGLAPAMGLTAADVHSNY